MKKFKLVYLLLISILIPGQSLRVIEAGVSALEITPVTGLKMAGFGARKSLSTGVMDPLYVRALVFRHQERKVAFVVYDLLYPFGREISDELRGRIFSETGIKEVIFSATHTHSGPQINSAPRIKDGDKIKGIPEFERHLAQYVLPEVNPDAIARTLDSVWGSTATPSYPFAEHRVSRVVEDLVRVYSESLRATGPAQTGAGARQ